MLLGEPKLRGKPYGRRVLIYAALPGNKKPLFIRKHSNISDLYLKHF